MRILLSCISLVNSQFTSFQQPVSSTFSNSFSTFESSLNSFPQSAAFPHQTHQVNNLLSQWALRLKQFPRFHREASLILENLSSVILLIFHLRDWDNLLQSRDLRTCLLAVLWLSTMVDASHIKMLTLLSVKQQRVYPLQDFALIPTGTSVMQK